MEKNGLSNPPLLNPYDFLLKKIEWRYAKGLPSISTENNVIYGDSTEVLKDEGMIFNQGKQFSLLFTSPPYCSLTDYHADQWLRIWFLNANENIFIDEKKYKGRFNNRIEYIDLLDKVFAVCSRKMKEKATVYVRTDVRELTFNITNDILNEPPQGKPCGIF